MQGDVFANSSHDRPEGQHAEAVTEAEWRPPPRQDELRWNPWTKRATKRSKDVSGPMWCFAFNDAAWWASFQFIIGSCLFAFASACNIKKDWDEHFRRFIVSWPIFIGGILFTLGSACLLYESIMHHPNESSKDEGAYETHYGLEDHSAPDVERPTEPLLRKFAGRWPVAQEIGTDTQAIEEPRTSSDLRRIYARNYVQPALYHIMGDPWYAKAWRLDVAGSIILLCGAAIYNTSCFSDLYKDYHEGHWPFHSSMWWLVWLPNSFGGVLFVAGSWLYWAAAHHTFSLVGVEAFDRTTYTISATNLLGSCGFLIGDALTKGIPALTPYPSLKVNWLQLFIGHVGGSLAFLYGSWLMVCQIAAQRRP